MLALGTFAAEPEGFSSDSLQLAREWKNYAFQTGISHHTKGGVSLIFTYGMLPFYYGGCFLLLIAIASPVRSNQLPRDRQTSKLTQAVCSLLSGDTRQRGLCRRTGSRGNPLCSKTYRIELPC